MKVADLIEDLTEMDPDAEIAMSSDQEWNGVHHIWRIFEIPEDDELDVKYVITPQLTNLRDF